MAHSIPRKALNPSSIPAPNSNISSGSPSPEPAGVGAGIKRKPVDIKAGNNRLSGIGGSAATTPQSAGFSVATDEPVELRFALGPGGLHAWYDPTYRAKAGALAVP